MMSTADHLGCFLDVEIWHPGAPSDYLCFKTSTLKWKVVGANFFASGLIRFGDNAYVDTKYMVVPFKNPKIELREDDFNFFIHSYTLMSKCAFGKLAHCWGILQHKNSSKIGSPKTTALVIITREPWVMALFYLHNYCNNQGFDSGEPLEDDVAYNVAHGGCNLDEWDNYY